MSSLLIRANATVILRIRELKTEASQKPVPLDGALAAALLDWSLQAPYRLPGDWLFASPKMHAKQPYRPETLLKCYVRPAAKCVGITKQIGWYSFRRTFATLLKGSGEDVKTVQEPMRHANSRPRTCAWIDPGRVRTGANASQTSSPFEGCGDG